MRNVLIIAASLFVLVAGFVPGLARVAWSQVTPAPQTVHVNDGELRDCSCPSLSCPSGQSTQTKPGCAVSCKPSQTPECSCHFTCASFGVTGTNSCNCL